MDTMNKEKLLEVMKALNDAPYKTRMARLIFESLQPSVAYGLAYEFYLKYYYTGTIVEVQPLNSTSRFLFTTVADTYKYIKEMYPKSNQSYIYDCLKGNKPHAYNHTFKYITSDQV